MRFAEGIVALLTEKWTGKITHVVGADTSSTALAEDVAKILGAKPIRMIKFEDASGKKQLWAPDNKPLKDGDVILHIEELITTAFSANRVREGIKAVNKGVKFYYVPYLPTIVDRSDPDNRVIYVENSEIISLLQLFIKNYEPDKCPYCDAGSEAIRAKDGNNWERLHGRE